MRLINMTDFVLEQCKDLDGAWDASFITKKLDKIHNYSQFLKQPLKLEMFIACDVNGNFLQKPLESDYDNYDLIEGGNVVDYEQFEGACENYNKAKEKVLFEGCSIFDKIHISFGNGYLLNSNHLNELKIEDLIESDLTLTKTALKQIGL
jgi:hypothetical protein